MECWDFRKIKFKNGENKKYFEKGIKKKKRLNLEFLENLKRGILNIKFELLEFWNFEKLFKKTKFENRILKN